MHWLFQNLAAPSCMSEIIALVRLCVTSMTMTDACRVNSFDASLSCFCYSALTLKAAKLGRVISEPALLCILACIFMSIYESEAIKLCFVFNRWGINELDQAKDSYRYGRNTPTLLNVKWICLSKQTNWRIQTAIEYKYINL